MNKYFKTMSSDRVSSAVLCHSCQEGNYPFTYCTTGLHGCKSKESGEKHPPKALRQNDNLDTVTDIIRKPNQKLAALKVKGNCLHSQCKSEFVECPLTLTVSRVFR